MDTNIWLEFIKQGPTILIMAIMIWWFMKTIDKKDEQTKESLNLFVGMQRDSNVIHSRTGELLQTMIGKLNEVHDDVRNERRAKP